MISISRIILAEPKISSICSKSWIICKSQAGKGQLYFICRIRWHLL